MGRGDGEYFTIEFYFGIPRKSKSNVLVRYRPGDAAVLCKSLVFYAEHRKFSRFAGSYSGVILLVFWGDGVRYILPLRLMGGSTACSRKCFTLLDAPAIRQRAIKSLNYK